VKSNNLPFWIIIIALALVVVTQMFTKPKPEPKIEIVETVDTLIVTQWKTQVIHRDRIVPKIVIVTDSSYTAVFDTLITHDSGEIAMQVGFEHPAKLFQIDLSVKTRVDTVYINRERIITNTIIKTNWNATLISGLIGFAAGTTAALLAH
jgi:hypothetical protein